jgi:hypothetical protein
MTRDEDRSRDFVRKKYLVYCDRDWLRDRDLGRNCDEDRGRGSSREKS